MISHLLLYSHNAHGLFQQGTGDIALSFYDCRYYIISSEVTVHGLPRNSSSFRNFPSSQFERGMIEYALQGPIAQWLEQSAHKARPCAFTFHAYRGRRH